MHSDAPDTATAGSAANGALYNQLMALSRSAVVALNRAVAVAEVEGPGAALALVDDLNLEPYYLFHAIRADLLRRLGRDAEAALAYEAAFARRRQRRRARLAPAPTRGARGNAVDVSGTRVRRL